MAVVTLAQLNAVVQSTRVPPPPVNPLITVASTAVLVKKTYTNPARLAILVGASAAFKRTGTLTRSGNTAAIKLFNAATGGSEITFDGKDNEFTGLTLQAGVQIFAEAVTPSAAVDDYTLTLDLAAGPTPIGPPFAISLTAVALQLDICVIRSSASTDPAPLPQPPAVQPPAGTATDKFFGGRVLNIQDARFSQERAMLIVRRPQPPGFAQKLVLQQIQIIGTNVGNLDNKAQLFTLENPNLVQPGQGPLGNKHPFDLPAAPAEQKFFVEGANPSQALHDTGFQLGIAGGESDGDRVSLTITPGPVITLASKFVVVKKPHTAPTRQLITLLVHPSFTGSAKLDRSGNTGAIKLFTAITGGTELTFNGNDNVFSSAQLTASHQLFAEGATASVSLDDYELTLTLTPGGTAPAGNPFRVRITAIEITLDIGLSRPTSSAPAPLLSAADKVSVGRFLIVQDGAFTHERALLLIQPCKPPAFVGTLEVTSGGGHAQIFTNEKPSAGQAALPATHPVPSTGGQVFVEGSNASGALRDMEFRLGLRGVEPIADLVKITVFPDPSVAGPFAVGEHEYDLGAFAIAATTETLSEEAQLDIGAPSRTLPQAAFSVSIKAFVRYPAQSAGVDKPVATSLGKYPLVILAHGNHGVFSAPGVRVESFRGLEYLARHLASYGYIAASIDLNDINVPAQRFPAILQRGFTILEHLKRWGGLNTGDPIFTGKVDLDQIALLGHSRGAEAVVSAQRTNVDTGGAHKIKSVISIAPTDFLGLSLPLTPYLVLYGSQDEDVAPGWPFRLYDRATAFKAMIFIYGAIHNRFSTDPDWLRLIDSTDSRRLSEGDHLNLAKGYCLGFLDLIMRNVGDHIQLFKRNGRPSTVSAGVELHHQVQDLVKVIVDDFEQGGLNRALPLPPQLSARASTNSLGGAVTVAGLANPTGFTAALTEASLQHRDIAPFWHDTVGAMVAWDAAGGQYTTAIGDRNVSAFEVLSFRVAQRFGSVRNADPPGATQDCTITIGDSVGQKASVQASTVAPIPFPYKRVDIFTKSALKTIRVPLRAFTTANAALNLNSVRSVAFVFNVTPRGELAIDDIEFSN